MTILAASKAQLVTQDDLDQIAEWLRSEWEQDGGEHAKVVCKSCGVLLLPTASIANHMVSIL